MEIHQYTKNTSETSGSSHFITLLEWMGTWYAVLCPKKFPRSLIFHVYNNMKDTD